MYEMNCVGFYVFYIVHVIVCKCVKLQLMFERILNYSYISNLLVVGVDEKR